MSAIRIARRPKSTARDPPTIEFDRSTAESTIDDRTLAP
jgi:hypothetical protein